MQDTYTMNHVVWYRGIEKTGFIWEADYEHGDRAGNEEAVVCTEFT